MAYVWDGGLGMGMGLGDEDSRKNVRDSEDEGGKRWAEKGI